MNDQTRGRRRTSGLLGLGLITCGALATAPAFAQTTTSTPALTSKVTQNLANPRGIPVEPPSSWRDKLRYEFLILSTARWQQDNGDLTELYFPGTTTVNRRWNPSGENFGALATTIGGSVGYERWLFALRLDSAYYLYEPEAHPNSSSLVKGELQERYINQLRPEYLALSYNGRGSSYVLGDYYMTLGRGMILSIRKVGDVGVDNKLSGAKAVTRTKFLGGQLTFTEFFGWTNIKNYEAGTEYYYPEQVKDREGKIDEFYDAFDFIAGGRMEYRFGKYLKVGAHGVKIVSPEDETGANAVVNGFGANIELPRPVKWLSMYAEVARLLRDDSTRLTADEPTEKGWGAYMNTNLYFGKTTILVEGKYYDNMFRVYPRGIRQPSRQVLNRIVEPPTAERPGTLLLANSTVYGGRARADYRVSPAFVPYIAGGLYRDRSFGRETDGSVIASSPPHGIYAVYGGARINKPWSELSVEIGHRSQSNQYTDDQKAGVSVDKEVALQRTDLDGSLFREDTHLTLDWRVPLYSAFSVELVVNYLRAKQESASLDCRVELAAGDEDAEAKTQACADRAEGTSYVALPERWHEGRVALSVLNKDGWSLTGAWEFYTRQPQQFKQHYFSVAGQYEFMKGGVVRALYGGERAGLKCSGGVCRFFPGFEGGRVELTMRL